MAPSNTKVAVEAEVESSKEKKTNSLFGCRFGHVKIDFERPIFLFFLFLFDFSYQN